MPGYCAAGASGKSEQLKRRALQRVMVSPTTIGDIAKSVLVLVQFEHKMIS